MEIDAIKQRQRFTKLISNVHQPALASPSGTGESSQPHDLASIFGMIDGVNPLGLRSQINAHSKRASAASRLGKRVGNELSALYKKEEWIQKKIKKKEADLAWVLEKETKEQSAVECLTRAHRIIEQLDGLDMSALRQLVNKGK